MNLSFAGCGFLGIYHVGVAVCFRKYAPHLLLNKISGASAGAIAACCLLCDLPLGDITSDVLRVCTEARTRTLGPFSPSFNVQEVLLEGLERFLPDDAHLRVNGKLHISLTRICDGKNVIVSHFESKQDLLNALMASAFIPFFSGWLPPSFHGVRYMDGGFSDNLPTLDENTITVSPFCGESDICPRDDSSQLFHINIANTSIELSKQNIYRFARILFPPKPEILSNMCKQGFDDALRFLHRNNLISCTRCLAVQSTFVVSETLDDSTDYDPQCLECKIHRQEALVSNMPETVMSIFQDAIDSANKGLVNWIFKHRGMKLLSVLSLPYTLPADIVYATFTKLNVIPTVKNTPRLLLTRLTETDFVTFIGNSFESHSLQYNVMGKAFVARDQLALQYTQQNNGDRRFLAAAPIMGNNLWDMSKFIIDQMNTLLQRVGSNQQHAKVTCQLAITEYGGSKYTGESNKELSSTTKNQVNLNFTLDLNDSDLPSTSSTSITSSAGTKTTPMLRRFSSSKLLSRRSSNVSVVTQQQQQQQLQQNQQQQQQSFVDDDTFDQILQVTAQHDAVMAYYYMDEDNKVKVTEIFDVTDSDSQIVQTPQEKETNMYLEFDDDNFEHSNLTLDKTFGSQDIYLDDTCSITGLSDISADDINDDKDTSLFSDPESEWNHDTTANIKDIQETLPESEQPELYDTMTTTTTTAATMDPYKMSYDSLDDF